MHRRITASIATILLALCAGSCAVTEGPDGAGPSAYAPPAQDPARIGLPPMYRPFYDELKDEGDWTLIEPYGWCFRPRVNFVAWRPYLSGWWEPSDSWGWIWNTEEPFGWVTYHYGSWFYDSYQGWVWQPGAYWGPAWVAWIEVGDYIGWAPLGPSQWDGFSDVPGGMFTYASTRTLASRDLGQQALYLTKLPVTQAPAREIMNLGRANGVAFNRGPDITRLLQAGAPVPPAMDAGDLPRVRLGSAPSRPNEADLLARTNRVTVEGVRELRLLREQGIAPAAPPARGLAPRPPVAPTKPPTVTPPSPEPESAPGVREHRPRAPKPAPADTTAAGDRPGRPEREPRPAHRDSTRGR